MVRRIGANVDVATLAQAVLAGERLAVARAMTLVEREHPAAHHLLRLLYPHSGRAHIVGVTGAPGTGKSTLVTALAQSYRRTGQTVGIVAIDPSSPFTGGALLGDRVRMRALSGDQGVFIRSMATRGSLGGLSKTTGDVVTILDAAGFDRILVETVGVGQAEVEIAGTAHTTLVVEAPGLGDEVQAIKAGILEIADLLVVNKADRPGADRTIRALQIMLEVDQSVTPAAETAAGQLPGAAWLVSQADVARLRRYPSMHKTVAATGDGVDALCAAIEDHRTWLMASGVMAARERLRVSRTLENIIRSELSRRVAELLPAAGLAPTIDAIRRHETNPYDAADELLARLG